MSVAGPFKVMLGIQIENKPPIFFYGIFRFVFGLSRALSRVHNGPNSLIALCSAFIFFLLTYSVASTYRGPFSFFYFFTKNSNFMDHAPPYSRYFVHWGWTSERIRQKPFVMCQNRGHVRNVTGTMYTTNAQNKA